MFHFKITIRTGFEFGLYAYTNFTLVIKPSLVHLPLQDQLTVTFLHV